MATAVNALSITWKQEMPGMYSESDWLSRIFQASILTYSSFLAAYFIEQPAPKIITRCSRRTNVRKWSKLLPGELLRKQSQWEKSCSPSVWRKIEMLWENDPKPSAQDEKCRQAQALSDFRMLVPLWSLTKSFLHLLLRIFFLSRVSKYFVHQRAPQFWILMSLMSQGCPALNVCSAQGGAGFWPLIQSVSSWLKCLMDLNILTFYLLS